MVVNLRVLVLSCKESDCGVFCGIFYVRFFIVVVEMEIEDMLGCVGR